MSDGNVLPKMLNEKCRLTPSATILPVEAYSDYKRLKTAVSQLIMEHPQITEVISKFSDSSLVVVKPNWVLESHMSKPEEWESVITHPNVVLAVVEVLADLMHGKGTICLCDAPLTFANFEQIVNRGQLKQRFETLRSQWPNLNLELLDLRREIWALKKGVITDRRPNVQDPRGYVKVNLKKDSLFYKYSSEGRYYGADLDIKVVNARHSGEVQEYLLSKTAMMCDLFINLPKMKTHIKAGITNCLKNLVGINGDKNWLPHFTEGTPKFKGDEFAEDRLLNIIEWKMKKFGKRLSLLFPVLGTWGLQKMRKAGLYIAGDNEKTVRNGSWYGNDTLWRMVLDLNRALLYGNLDGTLRNASEPKHYLAIVDGIIGGQGNGPTSPDAVAPGVLIGGTNPAEVDAVITQLMGFDIQKIPVVKNAFEPHCFPIARCKLNEIFVDDKRCGKKIALSDIAVAVKGGFKPPFGWKTLEAQK